MFKPIHNEKCFFFIFEKLIEKKATKEWMGCLAIKVNEFGYKEKDRRLKE